jgi:hypothetical protein
VCSRGCRRRWCTRSEHPAECPPSGQHDS